MSYYNRVLNEKNFDKFLFDNTIRSRQKYMNSSLDKVYSKSMNSDVTFKEIDDNIKKCYTNLQHLKNTFGNNKINLIKSSLLKAENNINCNNYNNILNITSYSRKFSNEKDNNNFLNNNKNSINLSQNNTLKNSSSSSTITDNFQKNNLIINDYKYKKNNIVKYPVESSYNLIFGKNRQISPSIKLHSSNNRNYFNSIQSLHNSSSTNEAYLSFLRKNEENKNKKNKNLFLEYQELKKYNDKNIKNENLIFENTNNNINEDINYKQKYKECLEQIEVLKISIQDYQKNNTKLKETIMTLNNEINNSNENKNIDLINKYKLEIIENNERILKLKEDNNKLKEENQKLIQENKDITKKITLLIDIIKSKDKVIAKIEKKKKLESDSSNFDSIEEKNNKNIYRRKSTKEYSFDKIKKEKNKKHIEEIKLKIPKYNNKGKIFEIPVKKYSYDQLLKENAENKIKINILNYKLKQYEEIQKKYIEIEENFKNDENLSRNYNKSLYLESLIIEGKNDEINTERTFSYNNFSEKSSNQKKYKLIDDINNEI